MTSFEDRLDRLWSVQEQTVLEEPIKIRWQEGKARNRVRKSLRASVVDGWEERGVAYRCFDRLKTKIVVESEEELEALFAELEIYLDEAEWGAHVGYNMAGRKAIVRVHKLLRHVVRKRDELDLDEVTPDK